MKSSILEKYIIRPALQYLDMESNAAVNLLLGTCAQESTMGAFVKQQNNGPAVGIYQIEPGTHKDVVNNYLYYRKEIYEKVREWQFGQKQDEHLGASVFYQTIIARLIYRRRPEKLPDSDDVKGLANYWKMYYNTPLGKGKETEFVHNYYKFVNGE